eukprot:RCo007959
MGSRSSSRRLRKRYLLLAVPLLCGLLLAASVPAHHVRNAIRRSRGEAEFLSEQSEPRHAFWNRPGGPLPPEGSAVETLGRVPVPALVDPVVKPVPALPTEAAPLQPPPSPPPPVSAPVAAQPTPEPEREPKPDVKLPDPEKPHAVVHQEAAVSKAASSGNSSGAAQVQAAFEAALLQWTRDVKRDAGSPPIEQSSAKFVDFSEPKTAVEMPLHEDSVDQSRLWLACDPRNATFTPTTDAACLQYIGNRHNIRTIKPMASTLSQARTIKFRITFRHGEPSPLRAIVKISQKKFLFEPHAEYLAFHLDRVLGLNRVPPTAWVYLPLTWIMACVTVMPPMYAQWVNLFVLEHPDVQPVIKRDPNNGERLIGVSVQLWMLDVVPLMDSVYSNRPHEAAPQLSDLYVFDFLLGNSDRSTKNTYVVGGCARDHCGAPKTRSKIPTQLIYLDQGSSFYKRPPPAGNPLTDPGNGVNSTFCKFRLSTYDRLIALSGSSPGTPTLW